MFMMLTACGEKQNSDLKHDHGKIVRTKNPLAWFSHSEISFDFSTVQPIVYSGSMASSIYFYAITYSDEVGSTCDSMSSDEGCRNCCIQKVVEGTDDVFHIGESGISSYENCLENCTLSNT